MNFDQFFNVKMAKFQPNFNQKFRPILTVKWMNFDQFFDVKSPNFNQISNRIVEPVFDEFGPILDV